MNLDSKVIIQDNLSREQRIRLEALTQACASLVGTLSVTETIINRARIFHKYIQEGKYP